MTFTAANRRQRSVGSFNKLSRYLSLGVSVAGLLAAPAVAADIEVKSENVIFVGDVAEADGKELVKTLEIYRDTILSLVGVKGKPDSKPLRVYGMKNVRGVQKFAGGRGIAGIYKQGLDGPVFVTTMKGGFDVENQSTLIAMHEYGHHILHGMSRDDFPRWYDEGFAEYLSSFRVQGDLISIGTPALTLAKSLRETKWLSPETVLGSINYYRAPAALINSTARAGSMCTTCKTRRNLARNCLSILPI